MKADGHITQPEAEAVGVSLQTACAVAWIGYALEDVLDHPKAVAMGAEELADWLRTEDH